MIIRPEGFKFAVSELVDPQTFKELNEEDCWSIFSQDAIDMLHGVRVFLNVPLTINNWLTGGQYKWSGYRSPQCLIGAKGSEHRLGHAFDIKGKNMEAEYIRNLLKENEDSPLLAKLTRIEGDTQGWTHIDCKVLAPGQQRIRVFKP